MIFSPPVPVGYPFLVGIRLDSEGRYKPYVGKDAKNRYDGVTVRFEGDSAFNVETAPQNGGER